MAYEVAERGDVVEVRGTGAREVREALKLREKYRLRQQDKAREVRDLLTAAALDAGLPIASPAALVQAERLAAHRAALLDQGAYTVAELTKNAKRGNESSTRTWLSRRRQACAVFTVKYGGRSLVPAFLVDQSDWDSRPELLGVLKPLLSRGIHGWELWSWLTSPSNLLSGEVPEQVAAVDPARAARAAQRFVAQLPAAG